jgi:hypothetical protein
VKGGWYWYSFTSPTGTRPSSCSNKDSSSGTSSRKSVSFSCHAEQEQLVVVQLPVTNRHQALLLQQ